MASLLQARQKGKSVGREGGGGRGGGEEGGGGRGGGGGGRVGEGRKKGRRVINKHNCLKTLKREKGK